MILVYITTTTRLWMQMMAYQNQPALGLLLDWWANSVVLNLCWPNINVSYCNTCVYTITYLWSTLLLWQYANPLISLKKICNIYCIHCMLVSTLTLFNAIIPLQLSMYCLRSWSCRMGHTLLWCYMF